MLNSFSMVCLNVDCFYLSCSGYCVLLKYEDLSFLPILENLNHYFMVILHLPFASSKLSLDRYMLYFLILSPMSPKHSYIFLPYLLVLYSRWFDQIIFQFTNSHFSSLIQPLKKKKKSMNISFIVLFFLLSYHVLSLRFYSFFYLFNCLF